MAELNFDASQVAPDTGSFAIPADWYNVMIDQSEIKPTKDGLGAYLQLRFTVVDGKYANSKLFARLNIKNASPVAQEIAYSQLSAIAHSVGVIQVANSELLHGIPLKIKVSLKPEVKNEDGSTKYDAGNDIKAYKNINEVTPGGEQAASTGAPAGFASQQAPTQQAPQQQATPQQQQAPAQQQGGQPWQQGQQASQPWQQSGQQAPAQEQAATPTQQAPQQAAQEQAPQGAPAWNAPTQEQAPQGGAPGGAAPWNQAPQ